MGRPLSLPGIKFRKQSATTMLARSPCRRMRARPHTSKLPSVIVKQFRLEKCRSSLHSISNRPQSGVNKHLVIRVDDGESRGGLRPDDSTLVNSCAKLRLICITTMWVVNEERVSVMNGAPLLFCISIDQSGGARDRTRTRTAGHGGARRGAIHCQQIGSVTGRTARRRNRCWPPPR